LKSTPIAAMLHAVEKETEGLPSEILGGGAAA
jgi:hypothetical protein